jgi:hypothetical protein
MIRLIFAALVAASPAAAQDCRGTADLYAWIYGEHNGRQVFVGTAGEVKTEIWVNQKGEWALVLTYPNGVSCLVAVGTEAVMGPNV